MYALRDWFSHTCAKRNHAFERGLIYGVLGNIKWFSALHHILLFAAGCASAAKQHSTRHVYVCTSCPLPCTFRPLLPASYSYLSCLLHLDPSQALGLMERTAPSGTMSGSTKKNAASHQNRRVIAIQLPTVIVVYFFSFESAVEQRLVCIGENPRAVALGGWEKCGTAIRLEIPAADARSA
jgi:hypothetical protein